MYNEELKDTFTPIVMEYSYKIPNLHMYFYMNLLTEGVSFTSHNAH